MWVPMKNNGVGGRPAKWKPIILASEGTVMAIKLALWKYCHSTVKRDIILWKVFAIASLIFQDNSTRVEFYAN